MTLNFSQRAASGSQCVVFRWWRMSLLSCPCHTTLTCYLREGRCPVTSGSESPCFWAHWCRFQITCRIEALGAKPGIADWKTPKMAFQWWRTGSGGAGCLKDNYISIAGWSHDCLWTWLQHLPQNLVAFECRPIPGIWKLLYFQPFHVAKWKHTECSHYKSCTYS